MVDFGTASRTTQALADIVERCLGIADRRRKMATNSGSLRKVDAIYFVRIFSPQFNDNTNRTDTSGKRFLYVMSRGSDHLHLHLSLDSEDRWGTTHDFTTSFLHFVEKRSDQKGGKLRYSQWKVHRNAPWKTWDVPLLSYFWWYLVHNFEYLQANLLDLGIRPLSLYERAGCCC